MKHRHTHAHRFALTGVALAAACLWSAQALALGLGRLNVQSVLGETLRAEIDITSLTPEEAASLRLRVAPPEAYRAAGLEYNAALAGANVTLERRGDGRAYLSVTGDRAVLEPFVDVIVEASWSSGRLVREYTMLFDPPSTRVATPAPVTPPVAAAPPAPGAAAPAPRAATPPVAAAAPSPTPLAARAAAPAPAMSGDEVRVRRGDSLSAIAARAQRPGVSLDQMLVALFRGNSQAFIGDNMNRLMAGAVLAVPSAEDAKKVSASEARQVIGAQSADFAGYRQRLASGAPAAGVAPAARAATGKVQTQVDDRKTAAVATPDKLTLSQGALKPGAPEAKASKDSERKDAGARLAELSRNVEELKRLQQGVTPPPAAATGKATAPAAAPSPAATVAPPTAPVVPPPAPVAAPPAAPPVAQAPAPSPAPAPAPAPTAAPSPAPVAAAPAPPAQPPAPAPAPAPAPKPPVKAEAPSEPGFLSSLMDSPLLIPGAAVLIALLAGLGVYRLRGSMRKKAGETSFLESRLQPDSFFGASGGQRVDTKDASGTAGGSSSVSSSYSLSQLDAIGDVDPVAEADVYLAYGRDLQAEEILKEAMRSTPDRLAIRIKLLEVYAKRRDLKGFELLATQVHAITGGQGEDWARAQALGRDLESDNPLYQPGGAPSPVLDDSGRAVEVLEATTRPHTAIPSTDAFVPAADATSLDSGLDLDLDLDAPPSRPSAVETTRPLHTGVDIPSAGLSLDAGDQKTMPMPKAPPPAPAPIESLDFDLGDYEPHPKTIAHVAKTVALPPRPAVEIPRTVFDVPTTRGDLRITTPSQLPGDDFGDFTLPASALDAADSADPLVRKLELAEEFRQIGDVEGARDLLEEVVAKADGALKVKAQGMLNGLG